MGEKLTKYRIRRNWNKFIFDLPRKLKKKFNKYYRQQDWLVLKMIREAVFFKDNVSMGELRDILSSGEGHSMDETLKYYNEHFVKGE